MSVADKYKTQR